jgi:hypothetical protein
VIGEVEPNPVNLLELRSQETDPVGDWTAFEDRRLHRVHPSVD